MLFSDILEMRIWPVATYLKQATTTDLLKYFFNSVFNVILSVKYHGKVVVSH